MYSRRKLLLVSFITLCAVWLLPIVVACVAPAPTVIRILEPAADAPPVIPTTPITTTAIDETLPPLSEVKPTWPPPRPSDKVEEATPAPFAEVGTYNSTLSFALGVHVVGNYAYTADVSGLYVIDVSDPALPAQVGSLSGVQLMCMQPANTPTLLILTPACGWLTSLIPHRQYRLVRRK